MKTCEEYVLNELEKTQNELQIAKKQLEEADKLIETLQNPTCKEGDGFDKTIKVKETSGSYYSVHVDSYYNFNKVLKDAGKTPKFLKDENNLEEFSDLIDTRYSYSPEKVVRISKNNYDMKLSSFVGKVSVIYTNYEDKLQLVNIDDITAFLDYELAKQKAFEELKKEIARYFETKQDEKFNSED